MGINNNKLRVIMVLLILFGSFILTGCKETYENNDKVKIAYVGDSTELPLITAFEEGYFKEEGLDVELVKVNRQDLVSGLNNKSLDAMTCDYRVFKYIEDGSNIKIGAGLYSGSIKILVGKESNIGKIDDLKNKKIGIQNKGEGTMILAQKLFEKYNINALKDIEWVYLDEQKLKESLKNGEVDGIIEWQNGENGDEDFKTIYKVADVNSPINAAHSSHSTHGGEFAYISFAGISKDIAETCPQKAGGILRAWIKGTNKVSEDKEGCLLKAIDNEYIEGDFNKNNTIINQYMYMPSVKYAKENCKTYIELQKTIGVLPSNLNENDFYSNSFADVLPYWD